MSELQVRMGGGFGADTVGRLSPALQHRMLAADAEHEAEGRAQARRRAERAAADEENRIVLSIEMARERGELVDVRQAIADGGVGRTVSEALSYYSALGDIEDARLAGQARRAQARLNEELYGEGATWVDTSAPHPDEVAADVALLERGRAVRARKREISKIAAAEVKVDKMRRGWV